MEEALVAQPNTVQSFFCKLIFCELFFRKLLRESTRGEESDELEGRLCAKFPNLEVRAGSEEPDKDEAVSSPRSSKSFEFPARVRPLEQSGASVLRDGELREEEEAVA